MRTKFTTGEYYHIYNRGVDKRKIVMDEKDCDRFLLSLRLLNNEKNDLMINWRDRRKDVGIDDFLKSNFRGPLVEIICYCLNPNHYHFILKQVVGRGVERFMQKLGTSFTKYFNLKNNRTGALFQGRFKSILIDSNEYLLYLSAYINRNYFIHGYGDNNMWVYSSLDEYLYGKNNGLCNIDVILDQINKKDYSKLLYESGDFMRIKKRIEKYLIE